jgi:hypothetical protein
VKRTNRSAKRCIQIQYNLYRQGLDRWNLPIFNPGCRASVFCLSEINTTNGFLTLSWFREELSPRSCTRINPGYTAGMQMGIVDCQSICGHPKTAIYASIVFGVTWAQHNWAVFPPPLFFLPRGSPAQASGTISPTALDQWRQQKINFFQVLITINLPASPLV